MPLGEFDLIELAEAYAERPVHIGHGQTISHPYIVALMTQEAGLTRGVASSR